MGSLHSHSDLGVLVVSFRGSLSLNFRVSSLNMQWIGCHIEECIMTILNNIDTLQPGPRSSSGHFFSQVVGVSCSQSLQGSNRCP